VLKKHEKGLLKASFRTFFDFGIDKIQKSSPDYSGEPFALDFIL